MKIIDAHLHLFPSDSPYADESARKAGHINSTSHLRQVYTQLGIVHGVVMGNRSLDVNYHNYPGDLLHYCVGIDSSLMQGDAIKGLEDKLAAHLARPECCGVKLYPGYNKLWLSDRFYHPVYRLAERYGKPVAVHTGLTSMASAHLKYCHPLALDQVAADYPGVNFVMCHFGNPFLEAAAAVAIKNPNVSVELSGLLEGRIDLPAFLSDQAGYISLLRAWLRAIGRWDNVLFGTDWPIVNLGEYIEFIKSIVPEEHWEAVFFRNANRIYGLKL